MYTITDLQKLVEQEISKQQFVVEPKGLYQPIEYVMGMGGKRIRPTMCLAGCYLFTDDIQPALKPSLSLEIFHNFTLLHDDIMDNADVRRNQATVHKKWDENTAILSGDAMLIKAYQYASKINGQHLKKVIDLFSQTAIEVCEGQQYDMEFETRDDVEVSDYLNMIRLKTAVLLAASLKTGAIIGGASDDDANLLYEFGENIGLAFQLQDDFLDVYGDIETFGKAIGGDIVANKKTFLLLNALQLASGSLRNDLLKWINAADFDAQEKIEAVKTIYNTLKVDELAREKMNFYFEKAIAALNRVNGRESMKEQLRHFAVKLIERSR
ncbi:polyprenyl synthetase family protein [Carboxylicivirga sediminis]|uniref:Polyprenyl synthetase family protein n=1 Tax=Carboxylicivirga sediminis TaxID=2006564 RepID=A0A941F5Y7_9BACT|nr:polyprenyl synthetase family protein [Carboxylicivirga sediminis]MBR8537039.1 polyprenyl synthetase family protein [Carboxylicivirga sediminis]